MRRFVFQTKEGDSALEASLKKIESRNIDVRECSTQRRAKQANTRHLAA
jgi:hypothetical protein